MNNFPIYSRIQKEIEKRKYSNLFRSLPNYKESKLIDFSTNSYLSLEDNIDIKQECAKLLKENMSGNLASRLVSVSSPLFIELEKELADWKGTETSLLFNTGYAANTGIISSIANKDTEIFSDRLNHASIIDGIVLSKGKMTRYVHCDMADLKKKLEQSFAKEKIIITDSVFSMDGDIAPLEDIVELAKTHKAMVIVDEAHATGIFGKNLSGLVEELDLKKEIDIQISTMSKSIAGMGAFFAGNSILKDYIVNTSRSFIYSTALPHSVLSYNIAAIRYIQSNKLIGNKLLQKSFKFRNALNELGYNTLNTKSQIIPCVIGNEKDTMALSAFLYENGINVPAIRPPTVPFGSARLRFSINLNTSESSLEKVLEHLEEWKK